jgi:hypothetical protein
MQFMRSSSLSLEGSICHQYNTQVAPPKASSGYDAKAALSRNPVLTLAYRTTANLPRLPGAITIPPADSSSAQSPVPNVCV